MLGLVLLKFLFVGGLFLTVTGYLRDHHTSLTLGGTMIALSAIILTAVLVAAMVRNGRA